MLSIMGGGGGLGEVRPWKTEGTSLPWKTEEISPPPGWKSLEMSPLCKHFFLWTHNWPEFDNSKSRGGGGGLQILRRSQKIDPHSGNFYKPPLALII